MVSLEVPYIRWYDRTEKNNENQEIKSGKLAFACLTRVITIDSLFYANFGIVYFVMTLQTDMLPRDLSNNRIRIEPTSLNLVRR